MRYLTTIDIDRRTSISSSDGHRWSIYRGGSLVSAMWGTEAQARERAATWRYSDSVIINDETRERDDRAAAVGGDGAGQHQFRAPR